MQDAILAELENSYEESRKGKEKGRFTASWNGSWMIWIVYPHADFASRSTEDLLVPNPNHAPIVPDDVSESGEEGDEE